MARYSAATCRALIGPRVKYAQWTPKIEEKFEERYLSIRRSDEEKLYMKIDRRDEIYATVRSKSRSEDFDERSKYGVQNASQTRACVVQG